MLKKRVGKTMTRKVAVLVSVCLVGASFPLSTHASPVPTLTAVADNESNMVKLNWTSSSAGQEYYMMYQKNADDPREAQSIPLKKKIKVLNIYPGAFYFPMPFPMPSNPPEPDPNHPSASLKGWMEEILKAAPEGYEMTVDKVWMYDFLNGETNYSDYLAKQSDGSYKYDVIYFGGYDSFSGYDLSPDAEAAIEDFIKFGGGVFLGHDTAMSSHNQFSSLVTNYFNMSINSRYKNASNTEVLIKKKGFLTNFPFQLGDVGNVLTVPESHSQEQVAKGDIWFDYKLTSTQNPSEYNADGGTSNFYLTTWNNTAFIQTGHSNGRATEDEQKILANTLFYLAQVSTDTSFDDRTAQDLASPDSVAGSIQVTYDSEGSPVLNWSAAADHGITYEYYLKTIPYAGGQDAAEKSDSVFATVTTGVKGYAVAVDSNPENTTDPGNNVTTASSSYTKSGLQPGNYYAHIKTIDKAGNTSAFVTVPFTIEDNHLTVATVDLAGSANDGKTKVTVAETAGDGNKLVYVNAGAGQLTIPSVGDTLTGYADLPEGGVIAAANGDPIGVAEIDSHGKVVKFGQTLAVVIPSASGLTPTATDVAGPANDGKTKVTVAEKTGEGNKLVYVNAGTGSLTEPNAGDTLTGYADLPEGGIINAANGDRIGVVEINSQGKVVKFGQTLAVVIPSASGLTPIATDPAGSANDGKTKVTVAEKTGEGNKLVYVNAGAGQLTIPSVGDTLTGYADLPEGGVIAAANGDPIGVAEIDSHGKVVKFGQTLAVVIPSASGLTPTATDVAGSANDGKTKVTVAEKTGEGNKLVYVNAGTGSLTEPNAGDTLTGYADLPADGIVTAANGDWIGVAEIDSEGKVVKFGKVRAAVEAERIISVPSAPASKGVEVLVNGKVEYAGKATLSESGGQTVTTIDVDQALIQAKLDAEGQGAVITIPWRSQSDVVVGQLTGELLHMMEKKDATLVLDTPMGAYNIPTRQVDLAALAKQWGDNVNLSDVVLQIHIAAAKPGDVEAAEAVAAKDKFTLMAPPVIFTVNAIYKDKSVEVTDYSIYVKRTIVLPQGTDPNKITTGIVIDKDGTIRHVPTKVVKKDDVYYAEINSLTNSEYGVVWHPWEFDDVANHWSKAAVNDMGSRMVVNGTDGLHYNPDANITRAEFAAIIVRGLGLRVEKGAAAFTDVAATEWYAPYVNTANKAGLIEGYEEGDFRPLNRITRQEAMNIMARAMKITGLQDKFADKDLMESLRAYKDADKVSDWAKKGVALSVSAHIVNGRTIDTLQSTAFITRAEVAAIIQRLLQKSDLI